MIAVTAAALPLIAGITVLTAVTGTTRGRHRWARDAR